MVAVNTNLLSSVPMNANFFFLTCRHSYGESFSKKKWLREMVGQRELLSAFAGVSLHDIKGLRAPFLAVS